ncbi:MAG: sugar phosphate isomerase/epimerase [Candidatus Latescibacteria bacterium]|jgi:sugar phosphate isomerase/epimerase|nr:sugar phosphate isomerase/epimerase [Candidatus Latescibacterota bacterium]MBT4139627.1 sugar phosphate isomerase/epimerase [Candidatus Latescibacterota bacterium]
MTWTSEQISKRLAISTAIFQKFELGAQHIARIREANILKIELSVIEGNLDYHNRGQVDELKNACESNDIAVTSVHGPFKLPYNTADEDVRKRVVEESLLAIQFAAEMGASVYVAHFGFKDHGRKTIMELLERTQDLDIVLTTENQTNQPLEPYMDIVDAVDSDRFGMIIDIGHTRDDDGINPFVKHDVARSYLSKCKTRVKHVHLHETFDLDKRQDHRPPMHKEGIIEWGEVFAALEDVNYTGDLVFEDGRGEDPDEWIQHTADFPTNFIERYGK